VASRRVCRESVCATHRDVQLAQVVGVGMNHLKQRLHAQRVEARYVQKGEAAGRLGDKAAQQRLVARHATRHSAEGRQV
jgi:hypothetical protein